LGLVHGSYILCVSTLEPRKNIGTLLDAYLALPEMLRRRFPLVIAGAPGWHSDALHERLRGAAARGVRYVQYVPEPNLPALYAGAAVFALASLYEGYGLPVLEAMASGVPVLASNASSLPEVTGPDALLLPPLDIDAWRYGIERALEDHAWRQRCIAGGILRARQATWERCVAGTLDVYQKAWAH
jgi:alpha-1,3-rhamnosyl/mannosyltransferase